MPGFGFERCCNMQAYFGGKETAAHHWDRAPRSAGSPGSGMDIALQTGPPSGSSRGRED